jgi:predicted nucleic acid-binding Zn ribbon protein
MRRSNTQNLGQLLKDFVREQRIDGKMKELEVVEYCQEMLGQTMGRYLRQISVREGVLYLDLESSVVRSELMMLREELRTRLNEKAGEEVIRKVVLR